MTNKQLTITCAVCLAAGLIGGTIVRKYQEAEAANTDGLASTNWVTSATNSGHIVVVGAESNSTAYFEAISNMWFGQDLAYPNGDLYKISEDYPRDLFIDAGYCSNLTIHVYGPGYTNLYVISDGKIVEKP